MNKRLKKIVASPKLPAINKTTLAMAVIFIFGIVGLLLLILARASTPSISIEPENGAKSGSVCTSADPNTSQGSFIRFGCNIRNLPTNIVGKATCDSTMPDATVALQDWLDSLPDNVTATLGKNKCYHVEFPLKIAAKTNFVFDGNGSTISSFTDGCDGTRTAPHTFINCKYISAPDASGRRVDVQDRDHLQIISNTNVTVRDLAIRGGKDKTGYDADYAFQHGISIGKNRQGTVTIDNVTIDQVWGDFVSLQGEVTNGVRLVPQNVTIKNSDFGLSSGGDAMGSGRQGISIDDGINVHIQDNKIYNVSRTSVDIEPVSTGAQLRDIYFDNNVFGPSGLNWFSNNAYGDANPVIDGIHFRNNQLSGQAFNVTSIAPNIESIDSHDPATYRRKNYEFINNISDTKDANGTCGVDADGKSTEGQFMRLWGIDGLTITGNTAKTEPNRCMHLINVTTSRDVRVTNNKLIEGKTTALRYYQSFNVCEADNMVDNPLVADTIFPQIAECVN